MGKEKGFVIEKGEGVHTHTLESDCDIFIDEKSGRIFLKGDKIEVAHEEHGKQTIESDTGIVYKDLERVFDYEEMESRNVID